MSKSPDQMDCPQILERLEAFVDDDLPAAEHALVSSHLDLCPDCSAEHRLALAVREELRSLPELDMPTRAVARVLAQTNKPSWLDRASEAIRATWLRPQWVGATAAAVLVAVVGVFLLNRPETTVVSPETDPAVAQAALEARYALALIGSVNHRAGHQLRDEVLKKRVVDATRRGLGQSLERALDSVPETPESHDPRATEPTRRQT